MASEEAKFRAAVNIIRSMPKNGPFQPSTEMMLRFYSLFKQAEEGPCRQPKPAFWEVVAKAKWDAWKALGDLSREEAMTRYVEELKSIVETMSVTANVSEFMHLLGPFYEAVYEGSRASSRSETDKEQLLLEDESGYCSSINGAGTEENESGDGGSSGGGAGKEEEALAEDEDEEEEEEEEEVEVRSVSPANSCSSFSSLYASTDKFYSDAESDDDYKDPLPETHQPSQRLQTMTSQPVPPTSTQGASSGRQGASDAPSASANGQHEQLHVTMAIQRLQADLQLINTRLETLESERKAAPTPAKPGAGAVAVAHKRSTVDQVGSFAVTYNSLPQVVPLALPKWFPLQNMNWATICVLLSWPFVAQYLAARLRHSRR